MASEKSEQMVAWVLVLAEPNEDDEYVELLEVNANRIPPSKASRSTYDWFSDHWNEEKECTFWAEHERPEPGEYLVTFCIRGEWSNTPTYGEDYDEEVVVEKIEKVDLGMTPTFGIRPMRGK